MYNFIIKDSSLIVSKYIIRDMYDNRGREGESEMEEREVMEILEEAEGIKGRRKERLRKRTSNLLKY